MELPKSIQEVVDCFAKLPGVGRKTALRQTLQLTYWPNDVVAKFGEKLIQLTSIQKCESCGFFSEEQFCSLCLDEERNSNGIICVVESISDFLAIENSGDFRGLYFILGGVLNPMLGVGPDELKIPTLIKTIHEKKIKEIILALNPSVEGDATCSYIKDSIGKDVMVERIGFGMPMGGSLEYLDAMTISKALENKTLMN